MCIFLVQAAQYVNQTPKPDTPPESSDTQYNFHYAVRRNKRGFIIIAEKNIYIYSESSLGPHLLLQSGFYISQEEIGWNSQHHSKLINETKSHNLKYRFIHLTNEAVYWWLIAVFVLVNDSFSLCTAASKNTGT